MPRSFLTLLLSLTFLALAPAQNSRLDGLWEGTMVVGGLNGTERLPMQLYITTQGRKVKGRSYVSLPDGSTLRMDLKGEHHFDNSISLYEVAFAGDPLNEIIPEFNRQYQIILTDDIWDPVLKGFWQEVTEVTFKKHRRLGRMTLARRKVDGA